MPLWIRKTAIVLAILLVLLIAAGAWLIASFDPNRYKGVAIDWMKTNRQRTLVIDGPIELALLPRLAVKLSRVSLSEQNKAELFASIESTSLSVDVLPLLRGELVVDRIEARGVRATLLRDAKGRRNTDDLAGAGDPKAPPTGTSGGASPGKALRFDVSRVELDDVYVRLKDDVAGIDGELELKELSTGRVASEVETPVKLVARFAFKAPVLKGDLSGATRLTPDLATGSVRLADMNLAFKGDVPGASAVDLGLKGDLAWDGAKGALEAKSLSVQLGANAAGLKLAGSTLAIDRFAYDPTRQALAVNKLALRVKGTRAGQPLALELDWPQLEVIGDKLQGSPLAGKLSLGGEMPLEANFKSGAPAGSFDALSLPGFEARITSDAAARKLAGTLRSNIGLRPAKASVTLDALDLQATIEDKGLKPIVLSARGNVSASAQAASWALTGKANANAFQIDGSANLAAGPPNIRAQAKFDALDLNTLLPAAASSGAAPGAPAAADAPVDLSALRSVNATVGVRAGSFVFRQYRVADAKIDAVLEGGMLKVNTLQGKAWGGTLDATAFADARASRITVKAIASGVNVNALLKDVAAKDILEGTGRVTLDVDTAGRSVAELRSHLRGNAALQLRDGAVKGVNLAKSLRQAKAALTMRTDSAQKASQTEKTDFSELTATFQIADGIARSKDLDAKSPFLRLAGDGAIDIGKGMIDYTARATVTSTSAGQDGAELAALKGLTVPVRLTGPFEAVDWKIQWSAVAAGALKNQLEDKLKDKLGIKAPAASGAASAVKPKDQLKEKLLKGLFK
jgi:AsmA protein